MLITVSELAVVNSQMFDIFSQILFFCEKMFRAMMISMMKRTIAIRMTIVVMMSLTIVTTMVMMMVMIMVTTIYIL